MSLASLFIGVPQSRYAAFAILTAVLVVSFTLLFGKDPIPFTQKMAFVLLMFLISLPGILLTLFQMTCLVTGAGFRNQRWWCAAYTWVVTILLVIYCVMLIAVAVISLTTGEKLLTEVAVANVENFEDVMTEANKTAAQYFVGDGSPDEAAHLAAAHTAASAHSTADKKKVGDNEADKETEEVAKFKVAGGASQPAAAEDKVEVVPEAFTDFEAFTSSCAPF